MTREIAGVVLAAGRSKRMKRPKQLLPHGGATLVGHAVHCAAAGGCAPVVVVLGARASEVRRALSGSGARLVLNEAWRAGLGSSVRAGIAGVGRIAPTASGALLLACDQPRLTPQIVQALIERFDGAEGRIVACEYAGTVGVPALFERSLFPELERLEGDRGAKSVIAAHPRTSIRLPWPDGVFDVDRPGDMP